LQTLERPTGEPRARCSSADGGNVIRNWKLFHADQSGQDMVEYTLLLAFVCLLSAALFIGVGRNVASIWGFANKSLSQAYSAANSSAS
jgi:Flp pilus assembly pilin Flp